jgi:hypothetical protein
VTICFCRPAKIALPSLIVNPTVVGENFSIRSIVATSYSVGLPGTTSATSFNVHFIPTAYAIPQLCMPSNDSLCAPARNRETAQNCTQKIYRAQCHPLPYGCIMTVGQAKIRATKVALGATMDCMASHAGKSVRVFKTAWFAKAARKAHISDEELCSAIQQVTLGQADDLGGGVFKKRLRKNQ